MKYVAPSIDETAFNCPYCGAYTSQEWASTYSKELAKDNRTPFVPDLEYLEKIKNESKGKDNSDMIIEYCESILRGNPFTMVAHDGARYELNNVWTSKCFNCNNISLWVYKNLVYPPVKSGPLPNQDLPDDIKRDFEEASSIVNQSPRGAAALLRLIIQKLCKHLGEKGDDLNSDIASLVRKGLNPITQKSLDSVRVIGNESVHPGRMDLQDDSDVARSLFDLVNVIAMQMITIPKQVNSVYEKLPEGKLKGIENRDKAKT